MEIYNPSNDAYNYTDKTQPLFEALAAGKTIKSITCMRGSSNKNNPENDFIILNVTGKTYYVAAGVNMQSNEHVDMLDIDEVMDNHNIVRDTLYMNWVRNFEI